MAPAGLSSPGRVLGVDAARGVALLGMMTVHIWPRSSLGAADVTVPYHLFAGRSAALFALLAGVGLALVSGGSQAPRGRAYAGAAASTLGRAVVILLVGLTLGSIPDNRVAVILAYYAVLFVLAVPFLPLGPRPMAALAVVVAVGVPVLGQVVRPDLAAPTRVNPTVEWLLDPAASLVEIMLTGYYPTLAWLAYVLAGLAVGGAALAAAAWVSSSLLMGVLGGRASIEAGWADGSPLDLVLTAGLYGTTPTDTWWWLAVVAPHSSTPFDLLHTMGTSAAVLGVALVVLRRPRRVLVPLIAMGSMTLTLYSLHVVLLAFGPRFSSPGREYAANVLVLVGLATGWRLVFARGPLEAVAALVAHRLAATVAAGPWARSAG